MQTRARTAEHRGMTTPRRCLSDTERTATVRSRERPKRTGISFAINDRFSALMTGRLEVLRNRKKITCATSSGEKMGRAPRWAFEFRPFQKLLWGSFIA